jgi:hypothetical protein
MTSVTRELPLAGLIEEAKAFQAWRMSNLPRLDPSGKILPDDELLLPLRPRRGGRRPTYGPEHYRRVAEVYQEAWAAGLDPTPAVMAWGMKTLKQSVTKTTAAKWAAKARQLGYLPETTRGRMSGWDATQRRGKR